MKINNINISQSIRNSIKRKRENDYFTSYSSKRVRVTSFIDSLPGEILFKIFTHCENRKNLHLVSKKWTIVCNRNVKKISIGTNDRYDIRCWFERVIEFAYEGSELKRLSVIKQKFILNLHILKQYLKGDLWNSWFEQGKVYFSQINSIMLMNRPWIDLWFKQGLQKLSQMNGLEFISLKLNRIFMLNHLNVYVTPENVLFHNELLCGVGKIEKSIESLEINYSDRLKGGNFYVLRFLDSYKSIEIVTQFKRLKIVNLSQYMSYLELLIKHQKNLKILEVDFGSIFETENPITSFLKAVSQLKDCEELKFHRFIIDSKKHIVLIKRLFERLPLKIVDLSATYMTNAFVNAVISLIKTSKTLKCLKLGVSYTKFFNKSTLFNLHKAIKSSKTLNNVKLNKSLRSTSI